MTETNMKKQCPFCLSNYGVFYDRRTDKYHCSICKMGFKVIDGKTLPRCPICGSVDLKQSVKKSSGTVVYTCEHCLSFRRNKVTVDPFRVYLKGSFEKVSETDKRLIAMIHRRIYEEQKTLCDLLYDKDSTLAQRRIIIRLLRSDSHTF